MSGRRVARPPLDEDDEPLVIDPTLLFLYVPQQQRPRQSRLAPGTHVAQPDQPFSVYLNRYWASFSHREADEVQRETSGFDNDRVREVIPVDRSAKEWRIT